MYTIPLTTPSLANLFADLPCGDGSHFTHRGKLKQGNANLAAVKVSCEHLPKALLVDKLDRFAALVHHEGQVDPNYQVQDLNLERLEEAKRLWRLQGGICGAVGGNFKATTARAEYLANSPRTQHLHGAPDKVKATTARAEYLANYPQPQQVHAAADKVKATASTAREEYLAKSPWPQQVHAYADKATAMTAREEYLANSQSTQQVHPAADNVKATTARAEYLAKFEGTEQIHAATDKVEATTAREEYLANSPRPQQVHAAADKLKATATTARGEYLANYLSRPQQVHAAADRVRATTAREEYLAKIQWTQGSSPGVKVGVLKRDGKSKVAKETSKKIQSTPSPKTLETNPTAAVRTKVPRQQIEKIDVDSSSKPETATVPAVVGGAHKAAISDSKDVSTAPEFEREDEDWELVGVDGAMDDKRDYVVVVKPNLTFIKEV